VHIRQTVSLRATGWKLSPKGALARPVHRKSRRLKSESAISRLSYQDGCLRDGR
jgi:hypothetical protein